MKRNELEDARLKRSIVEAVGLLNATEPREVGFTAYGTPKPQGSQETRAVRKGDRWVAVAYEKASVYAWRNVLAWQARTSLPKDFALFTGALAMELVFYRPRPKSWPKARQHDTARPDVDKLARAVLDGLQGVLYREDSQVVRLTASKALGEPARVEIVVRELP